MQFYQQEGAYCWASGVSYGYICPRDTKVNSDRILRDFEWNLNSSGED